MLLVIQINVLVQSLHLFTPFIVGLASQNTVVHVNLCLGQDLVEIIQLEHFRDGHDIQVRLVIAVQRLKPILHLWNCRHLRKTVHILNEPGKILIHQPIGYGSRFFFRRVHVGPVFIKPSKISSKV